MSGTNASFSAPGGASFPAPKLRLRSRTSGAATVTILGGSDVSLDAPVEVVLSGLPTAIFEAEREAEIRLFRYSRAKSRSSRFPTPARWAPLPHVEGGGNSYARSGWLGSTPATGGADRFSRILLAGFSAGDVVDVTPLLGHWLRFVKVYARDAGAAWIGADLVRSTWAANRIAPSWRFGLSPSIEPVRFAVGFVGRNDAGTWDLLSPLSKFIISSSAHPFVFDPDGTQTLGNRAFKSNPLYDPKAIEARISDSEWLAGK